MAPAVLVELGGKSRWHPGASLSLAVLPAGQGAPGAQQPQAWSPSQVRSGWLSQTQPLSPRVVQVGISVDY
jgi:hypothetical protein